MQYTPYCLPYVISGLVTTTVGIMALRRRGRPGAIGLALFMAVMSIWSFGNAAEHCSVTLQGKAFWTKVEYIGIATVPVGWFSLSLRFAGRREGLTKRNVALLLVVPAIVVVLAWTNDYHYLMRYNIALDTSGPFPVIVKEYGPAFWAMTAYGYTLVLLGTINVARTVFGLPNPYRAQGLVAMLGAAIPWAANMVYLLGLSPVPRLDITPIGFAASGLLIAIGVRRYGMLDIQPIALAMVVDDMDSGVLVVDAEDRIVYMNAAAERITGWRRHAATVQATEVFKCWPASDDAIKSALRSAGETALNVHDGQEYYEVRVSPVSDRTGCAVGKAVVINDITERVRSEQERVSERMALVQHEEREMLARDLHDSIGQTLGYLNVQLQAIRGQALQQDAKVLVGGLDGLVDVVQEACAELRQHIAGMRGATEERWEFVPKLREMLRGYEIRHGIRTELEMPAEIEEGTLGRDVQFQLLRIIQEACTNAVKHARASKMRVAFEFSDRVVEVLVKDDGAGFSPAKAGRSRGGMHLGLGIMRERAESLGGDLYIQSAPGEGTEVRVCIPIKMQKGVSPT